MTNRVDGIVQAAIELLRKGVTLATAARHLGVNYRQLQKKVRETLSMEEYLLVMVRKGKKCGPQQKPSVSGEK